MTFAQILRQENQHIHAFKSFSLTLAISFFHKLTVLRGHTGYLLCKKNLLSCLLKTGLKFSWKHICFMKTDFITHGNTKLDDKFQSNQNQTHSGFLFLFYFICIQTLWLICLKEDQSQYCFALNVFLENLYMTHFISDIAC